MMSAPTIIGCLPRSGSTLLAALLRQNPVVDVTPTGFLLGLVQGMQNQWSASDARKGWKDQEDARRRLHGAIAGAIGGYLHRGHWPIEKSRGGLAYFDLLERALGEPPRIILPVRDLRGCVASMEKLWRGSPEHAGLAAGPHIGQRVDGWLAPNAVPLGSQLAQLADAQHRGLVGRCLIVRYEDLAAAPAAELRRVYAFCGYAMPEGVHDFEQLEEPNREHDAVHGPFGDHAIPPGPVRAAPEDWNEVLGEPISRAIVQRNEWFYRSFYPERLPGSSQAAAEQSQ